jgi:hypothetical protein
MTLFVLVCCLFALGSATASLDEAVSSDPGDAVDPNWEELPIGKEEASRLKDRWRSAPAETGEPSSAPTSGAGPEESEGADPESSQSAGGSSGSDGSEGGGGSDGSSGSNGGGGSDGSSASGQTGSNQAGNGGGTTVTKHWKLLGLLFGLVWLLLVGLLFAGLFGGVRALVDRFRSDEQPSDEAPNGPNRVVGPADPSNDVSQAWVDLMDRTGLADAHHLTPDELAAAAIERGADPDAVRSLTELFKQTRYGGASVTDDRSRRAQQWLERATDGVRAWTRPSNGRATREGES